MAQLALIEVDHVDLRVLVQQQVVCVEVGVAHAQVVKSADTAADLDPGENGQGALRETFRERSNSVETLRDDIARVGHSIVLITGAEGCRDGQSRAMQPVSQLPLRERSRLLLAPPEVSVT